MRIMCSTSSKNAVLVIQQLWPVNQKVCGMKVKKLLNRLAACLGEQHPRRISSFKSFEDGIKMATPPRMYFCREENFHHIPFER